MRRTRRHSSGIDASTSRSCRNSCRASRPTHAAAARLSFWTSDLSTYGAAVHARKASDSNPRRRDRYRQPPGRSSGTARNPPGPMTTNRVVNGRDDTPISTPQFSDAFLQVSVVGPQPFNLADHFLARHAEITSLDVALRSDHFIPPARGSGFLLRILNGCTASGLRCLADLNSALALFAAVESSPVFLSGTFTGGNPCRFS